MARRNESEWREIVDRQRESGLTDKEFAELEDVGIASLRNWRYRLERDGVQPSGTLVELAVATRADGIKVCLPNGVSVEVRSSWESQGLVELIGRLKKL